MNFDSLPSGGQPEVSLRPEWQRRVDRWRELLAQCGLKPSRKRVHALRCSTLRLKVALENWVHEQGSESKAARAFKQWNKEGSKLRRALQPVRDADVYLARLASLRDTGEGASDAKPQLSPRCLREIDKLESRLKRKREAGIGKLTTVIGDRSKRLNRLSKEIEGALEPLMPAEQLSTGPTALRTFTSLAGEFPHLDSSNLHAYRKRLKQALYLAEISAQADPEAGRLAGAFRKIHLAVGQWHDWQALALEAGHLLPGHDKQDGLIGTLKKLEESALERALVVCRRSAKRLIKGAIEIHPSPPRKPVAADPGFQIDDEDLSSGISS